jgi:hypothetical protein
VLSCQRLDPAGPLFENYDKRVRLDSTDAIFVDVIHSNGDSLLMGGLGSWEPIGHLGINRFIFYIHLLFHRYIF